MYVVIFGLFVIFFAVAVAIIIGAGASSSRQKREIYRREREADQMREAEAELARLSIPGEPLICLGCRKRFSGPMPENGCPDCQISSLVVSERSGKNSAGD